MKKKYIIGILFIFTLLSKAQTGNSLNFDGVDDYIQIDNSNVNNSFALTTSTVECWFRMTNSTSYNKTLFSMRSATGTTNTRYSLHVNPFTSNIGIYNGSGFFSYTDNIVSNTWYHIAFVLTSSTTKVYINGVLKNTINNGYNNITGEYFEIGRADAIYTNEYFQGDIDEVRVWDDERTATEIANSKDSELVGNESGLVAYYKFNQGVANGDNSTIVFVDDSTSNNHQGTLSNFSLAGTTSNFTNNSTLSIEDQFYPTKNKLIPTLSNDFITITGLTKNTNFKIFNLEGQEILTSKISPSERINIKNLNNGIYFLKLENGKSFKFLKN